MAKHSFETYRTDLFTHLRTHRFFWISVTAAILAAIGIRLIWNSFGDHTLISPISVDLALGLVFLNFILAAAALPREPFASSLLVGAALIEEFLVMIFLYQV